MLTQREQEVLENLKAWERTLATYEQNDFSMLYEKYVEEALSLLPEEKQKELFSMLDTWIFHLHALIQGSDFQRNSQERILTAGRLFREDIDSIKDLKSLTIDQLQYIAKQQISTHHLYSFAQGGFSGTGGIVALGTDIPAMTVINLRIVQLIALTYGNDVNHPFEMMTSLKVFHAATLPPQLRGDGWNQLMNELADFDHPYFYDGDEEMIDATWFQQPLKQLIKGMAIILFRGKKVQNVPVISMAIGAGMNYRLTKRVTEFAHNYYRKRHLMEKGLEE